jgi:hypothetical protein
MKKTGHHHYTLHSHAPYSSGPHVVLGPTGFRCFRGLVRPQAREANCCSRLQSSM